MSKRCTTCFVLGLALAAFMAPARTLYVAPGGSSDWDNFYPDWAGASTNIIWAVARAADGDTILVTNTTYVLTNEINLGNKYLTIQSWHAGALDRDGTIIDGNSATRCLYFQHKDVLVAGFTIRNGNGVGTTLSGYGGGVCIGQGISHGGVLSNCVVRDSSALVSAGGVYARGTNTLLVDCLISGNQSLNTLNGYGGGVFLYSARMLNCGVFGNTNLGASVNARGGGVFLNDTNASMGGCVVSNNTAANVGGGVAVAAGSGAILADNTIVDNTALAGGGVYLRDISQPWVMAGGVVARNRATIADNSTGGGGIFAYNAYNGVISNVAVMHNTTETGYGGGLYAYINSTNQFRIVDCSFTANTNKSAHTSRGGGGVAIQSTANIENCLISSNTAFCSGGGVLLANSGYNIPALRNCLVVHNAGATNGGGVMCFSTTLVENCTIALNTAATRCGGLFFYTGTNILVRNTICVSNTAPANANWGRNTAAVGYTFVHGGTSPTNDLIGSNNIDAAAAMPLFVDLPGGNLRLADNVPAIDAGLNQAWMDDAVDLDRRPRRDRWRKTVDMGCYEKVARGSMINVR